MGGRYDAAQQMENVPVLGAFIRNHRPAFRPFDKRCRANFQPNRRAAASCPTCTPVSGCMGRFICPDGHQRCPNQSTACVRSAQQGAVTIFDPTHRKFLLESAFFQCPSIRSSLLLADSALGIGAANDSFFSENRSCCRISADPILALADICRLFKRRRLVFEPIKTGAHPAPVFCIIRVTFLDMAALSLPLPDHPEACRLPQIWNRGKGNPMCAPGDSTSAHIQDAGSGVLWVSANSPILPAHSPSAAV